MAEGRRASAMTRRTGAEKRRREMSMVIRTNTVFTTLTTLLDFSSFDENPIITLILSDLPFLLLLIREDDEDEEEEEKIFTSDSGYGEERERLKRELGERKRKRERVVEF